MVQPVLVLFCSANIFGFPSSRHKVGEHLFTPLKWEEATDLLGLWNVSRSRVLHTQVDILRASVYLITFPLRCCGDCESTQWREVSVSLGSWVVWISRLLTACVGLEVSAGSTLLWVKPWRREHCLLPQHHLVQGLAQWFCKSPDSPFLCLFIFLNKPLKSFPSFQTVQKQAAACGPEFSVALTWPILGVTVIFSLHHVLSLWNRIQLSWLSYHSFPDRKKKRWR